MIILCGSLFLLFCGTMIPAKRRSTGHVQDLLTRRTEQLQQGNTRGSDPVHAGSAEPTEHKHGALIEQIDDANNKGYGRSSEKLDAIAGQLELELIFNEAESLTETFYVVEPAEEDVVQARRRKRLPDEIHKRVGVQPAVYTVEEHHVVVYAGKGNQTIIRADHPKNMFRYLEHVLTVLKDHQDDTDYGFIEELLSWLDQLPEIWWSKSKTTNL